MWGVYDCTFIVSSLFLPILPISLSPSSPPPPSLVMYQNPANISQGQYQAIHPASFSSPPPQENEYYNLDPSSRESTTEEVATPSTVIPPCDCAALHKTGTQGQYMKLNPDTRDQVEPSYYMEMTASHPKGHRHLI